MGADNPAIENAVEYIQRLQAKYGITQGADGDPNSILDKEHLLRLLMRMEQVNEEIRAERDDYQHNMIAMLKEQFGDIPLPPLPPAGECGDMEDLIKELEELAHK